MENQVRCKCGKLLGFTRFKTQKVEKVNADIQMYCLRCKTEIYLKLEEGELNAKR